MDSSPPKRPRDSFDTDTSHHVREICNLVVQAGIKGKVRILEEGLRGSVAVDMDGCTLLVHLCVPKEWRSEKVYGWLYAKARMDLWDRTFLCSQGSTIHLYCGVNEEATKEEPFDQPVGWQHETERSFVYVTDVESHPSRLVLALRLVAGDPSRRKPTGQLKRATDAVRRAADGLLENQKKLKRLGEAITTTCASNMAHWEHIAPLLQEGSATASKATLTPFVPLVDTDRMTRLRSRMHLAWDHLLATAPSKKITVQDTCDKLVRLFPTEYGGLQNANNLRNRLRYYNTNFKTEKLIYFESKNFITDLNA